MDEWFIILLFINIVTSVGVAILYESSFYSSLPFIIFFTTDRYYYYCFVFDWNMSPFISNEIFVAFSQMK